MNHAGNRKTTSPTAGFLSAASWRTPCCVFTWISAFDAYLCLVELERGEDLTASTKNGLPFSLLGQEGLRQFGNDPAVATMTKAATTHAIFQATVCCCFKWTTNVACACFDFHMRQQGPVESVAEFVASLRELAPDCYFPADYNNRALAEQLVCSCYSSKACEESDEVVQEDLKIIATGSSSTSTGPSFQCPFRPAQTGVQTAEWLQMVDADQFRG